MFKFYVESVFLLLFGFSNQPFSFAQQNSKPTQNDKADSPEDYFTEPYAGIILRQPPKESGAKIPNGNLESNIRDLYGVENISILSIAEKDPRLLGWRKITFIKKSLNKKDEVVRPAFIHESNLVNYIKKYQSLSSVLPLNSVPTFFKATFKDEKGKIKNLILPLSADFEIIDEGHVKFNQNVTDIYNLQVPRNTILEVNENDRKNLKYYDAFKLRKKNASLGENNKKLKIDNGYYLKDENGELLAVGGDDLEIVDRKKDNHKNENVFFKIHHRNVNGKYVSDNIVHQSSFSEINSLTKNTDTAIAEPKPVYPNSNKFYFSPELDSLIGENEKSTAQYRFQKNTVFEEIEAPKGANSKFRYFKLNKDRFSENTFKIPKEDVENWLHSAPAQAENSSPQDSEFGAIEGTIIHKNTKTKIVAQNPNVPKHTAPTIEDNKTNYINYQECRDSRYSMLKAAANARDSLFKKFKIGEVGAQDETSKQNLQACIQAALIDSRKEGIFKYKKQYRICEDETGEPEKSGIPPCASQELNELLSSSFMSAYKCLGLSPQAWFPVINHESRFEPNMSSQSGACGPGQITGTLISDINKTSYDKVIGDLDLSDACSSLFNIIKTNPMHPTNLCSRVAFPNGPLKNFLYAAIFSYQNLESAKSLVNNCSNISEKIKEDAAQVIARWMYNGGIGGVSSVVKSLCNSKASTFDNLNTLKSKIKNLISSQYGGKKATQQRRSEVANYVYKIEDDLKDTEQAGGGLKCSR
jgi:hypothetical protein